MLFDQSLAVSHYLTLRSYHVRDTEFLISVGDWGRLVIQTGNLELLDIWVSTVALHARFVDLHNLMFRIGMIFAFLNVHMLMSFRVLASWTVISKLWVQNLFRSAETVQSDLLLVFIVLLKNELADHLSVKKHFEALRVDLILLEAVVDHDFQVVVRLGRSIDS